VETSLKGYKYFEIGRDCFNKLSVPIDGDFKFGVLLLVFVRFLGGDKKQVDQFCRKQLPKLSNLLMHSQCALSEPISSSRNTRKLTVCRFI
jgi:hypothetical protein